MIRANEITELIRQADNGDNLEIKIENRISMGDYEEHGNIIVERVKTPDYIRITRIYKVFGRDKKREGNLQVRTGTKNN